MDHLSVPWEEVHVPTFVSLAACFSIGENGILYPLELLKTRAQVDSSKHTKNELQSMVRLAQNAIRHDGIRSLYRGFGWFTFATLPSNIAYITSYNYIKQRWMEHVSHDNIFMRSAVIPMVSGTIADVLSIFLWNPVEIIVQRLQIEKKRPHYKFFETGPSPQRISNLAGVAIIQHILQKEGWAGFYRGLTASLISSAPQSAIWWPAYECSKLALAPLIVPSSGDPSTYLHVLHSVAGLFAGGFTMVCSNPFDVAKTRIQTQTETYGARTALPTITKIFEHEGVRGLMKGLLPRLAYSVPASGLVSFTYELVLSLSKLDGGIYAYFHPIQESKTSSK